MLGSSLCQLYQKYHDVYALHRDKECYASCRADFSLDLMDHNELKRVFDQIEPNLVIHCAGMISVEGCEQKPELAYEANVVVAENIARICYTGTKLVYISSDQVYGEVDNHSEDNKDLKPLNQYGKTKYLGEQKVLEYCSDSIIIRTNIFGWNVKPDRVSSAEWIYNSLKNRKEITLFTDYTFSPIYTIYLGEIIMRLVDMDFTGVINVGSPITCSKYGFGIQLAEDFGFDKSLIKKGSINEHHFLAPRVKNLLLNTERLSDSGITAPNYETSIKKFKENQSGI